MDVHTESVQPRLSAPRTRSFTSWSWVSLWALMAWGLMTGCTTPDTPSSGTAPTYQPQRGQMGKDVMWLPTSANLVKTMLSAAHVTSEDLVVDLGAGDGIIPIMAAQLHGARALGIEYNAKLAAHAQQQVERAGVASLARIVQGDIFQENFSAATVVTMYLLPELNLQLRPTLLAMKPGTRLVSHAFDMGDWEPDQVLGTERERAYLWIVPAQLAGRWLLRDAQGHTLGTFVLQQRFQRVGGQMLLAGASQPLLGARVDGTTLRLQYIGQDDGLHAVSLKQTPDGLQGDMTVHGVTHPVSAQRIP